MNVDGSLPEPWGSIGARLRDRGLRWTPQRETVIAVLSATVPGDHVTAAELVERCRARDGRTVPSTVYRTLDVLEDLGLVRHGHGADGREEYHVLPAGQHGHLHCSTCSATWEITADQADAVAAALKAAGGFEIDIGHVTLVGRCADCAGAVSPAPRR